MPVLTLLLELLGPTAPDRVRDDVAILAPVIEREARAAGIRPEVVAAVAVHESTFRVEVVGASGELGLMQIHPRGMRTILCRGLDVRRPEQNIRCGVRILSHAKRRCGKDPAVYLGAYSGRRCGPSRYATRILRRLKRAGWGGG